MDSSLASGVMGIPEEILSRLTDPYPAADDRIHKTHITDSKKVAAIRKLFNVAVIKLRPGMSAPTAALSILHGRNTALSTRLTKP